MSNRLTGVFLVVVGLLAVAMPLTAHHGAAAFETDPAKRVVLKGTVTEWFWANPHCFLKLDVVDDSGQVVHWVVEASNPSDMTDRGWTKQSMKPGDQVAVTIQPVRDHRAAGRTVQVAFPDGHILNAMPSEPRADTAAKP